MNEAKPKFNYGDYVYHAHAQSVEGTQPCPDCGGRMFVEIIYQGISYTLDCPGCERGYLGSTGTVAKYEYVESVREGEIYSVSKDSEGFEYRMKTADGICYILKESDIFLTREEAEARAYEIRKEREDSEVQRTLRKHNPDRTWAWNVSYHKRQIAEAQKNIEYHTLKLNAAKKYAKEDK